MCLKLSDVYLYRVCVARNLFEANRHCVSASTLGKSPKSWWTCSTRTDRRCATRDRRSSWSQTSSAIWRIFRSLLTDSAVRPSSPPSPPFKYLYSSPDLNQIKSNSTSIKKTFILITDKNVLSLRIFSTSRWSIWTRCTRRRSRPCRTPRPKIWTRNKTTTPSCK